MGGVPQNWLGVVTGIPPLADLASFLQRRIRPGIRLRPPSHRIAAHEVRINDQTTTVFLA
jgi:hypothetical protein